MVLQVINPKVYGKIINGRIKHGTTNKKYIWRIKTVVALEISH